MGERFRRIREFQVRTRERRVSLAEDALLRRRVILKSDTDPRPVQYEASLLSAVRSCNVVSCLDLATLDGKTTLVVELFCEAVLSDALRREGGRFATGKALVVADGILRALQDMNDAGVLYRDLHPGHVSYADRTRLKLYDLELAVRARPRGRVSNPHTAGTWETMAPEEYEVGAELGPPANVYSAASLVFRMIAGDYPLSYTALVPGWRSMSVEAQKQRQHELHCKRMPDLAPLPRSLRGIFEKALAKRPADRYPTVREFADALARAGAGAR